MRFLAEAGRALRRLGARRLATAAEGGGARPPHAPPHPPSSSGASASRGIPTAASVAAPFATLEHEAEEVTR